MEKKTVMDLKSGEWFTLKEIEEPRPGQVWVRGAYCREEKKYCCYSWEDVCRERLLRGSTPVFTGFTF